MRSQAQYTIHSLNDVIASTTAPTNPYKGQLWVNTSQSPPVTKVYNGSAWKEQNGTDTLRSNITTLTTKQSTFQTNLNGLTSEVSAITTRVETVESDTEIAQENLLALQEDVSALYQTASEISAEVSNKADAEYGTSSSTFGWKLKFDGFYLYSGGETVMSVTSTGLNVTGAITANSGSLGNMTITGKLLFGGDTTYYISANYNDSSYYINLPGLRIDKASKAVFSGKLSAPSGTIGGFTISTSSIYKTKTSYGSTTEGVYIGTDGIGLGAGTFYVTAAGKLYATDAEITGTINATSGSFSGSITSSEGTIGGFTIGASGLTNENGGSYIQIKSGNYTTKLSANSIYATYTANDITRGWSLALDRIQISAYSSTLSGVRITPTYTKRTSTSVYTSTTVQEGCITSVRDTYYNVDSGSTITTATPFIIGIPREYAKSPYVPANEWGSYARFVNYQTAELVYDSAYSGKWQLRNVSGSTYNLVDLIPYIANHKYYVWTYTSSLGGDAWASITSTTHGLSSISGAVAIPRSTSSSLSGYSYNGCLVVRISGTTVYVGNDNGSASSGFYCIIFGS